MDDYKIIITVSGSDKVGIVSSISTVLSKYKVNIEAIPKGYYIPEYDDLPVFEISDGDSTATIELYPGLYRFLNCSSLIYISIRVNSDGSYDIRSYKPII